MQIDIQQMSFKCHFLSCFTILLLEKNTIFKNIYNIF